MTPTATSQRAYQQSAVLTAPPERLVLMLYDGAGRFLHQASRALTDADVATANGRLQRAEAIIDELLTSLDPTAGEVAENLRDLYLFCRRHLAEARIERDPRKIDAVAEMLAGLREAWAQIAQPAA